MGIESRRGTPRWILVATGLVGLGAAVLLLVARYHELRKARAEADRAEAGVKTQTPPPATAPPAEPGKHPSAHKSVPAPPPPAASPDPFPRRVRVETSHGPFVIDLDHRSAPKTADAFLTLACSGTFDGGRVSPGTIGNRTAAEPKGPDQPYAFRLYCGQAPKALLRWEDGPPADTTPARGAVCVDQRTGAPPGFVVQIGTAKQPQPGFVPFGTVTDGLPILDRLAEGSWQTKNGARVPVIRAGTEVVVIRSTRVVP